ncbi:hypothetical protein NQ315_007294 [Exocentrus adspersus]|uniref:ZAD domain-containing protein n=1 Tax=Exocentrus adspersus TaxID=1586481 RepID=A0AAV8WD04_9CUCU|nr:hypothetical protein NQ315_007294 [Exocentrus adspersus]
MAALNDVCRLCLTTEDLVWVFDKRFESSDNMKDVIHITTGVKISPKDNVSQKICTKCCQVTIKMFEFRRTSLRNDLHLREQFKIFLKELKDKEQKAASAQVESKSEPCVSDNKTADTNKNDDETTLEPRSLDNIHPSVRELCKVYPKVKLPTICLRYDIAPSVAMKMNQVENYFKSRNLNFQECTKLAMRMGRVATKKTSTPKTKNIAAKARTLHKNVKMTFKDSVNAKDLTSEKAEEITITSILSSEMQHIKLDKKDQTGLQLERPTSNKRKSSTTDIEIADGKVFKKTNFTESLGLKRKTDSLSGTLSYVANKSMPVHICEICNSVQYSANELRRHQNSHLRCQLCKLKLRSLELKEKHLKNACPIKNMMNNLPEVRLRKVELNTYTRRKYHEAFTAFPPLKDESTAEDIVDITTELEPTNTEDFSDSDDCKLVSNPERRTLNIPSNATAVIEILSDDDDPTPSSLSARHTFSNTIPGGDPESEKVVYNTVSIVRPDIKVKGCSALDFIDARLTDIKVLKELLTVYRPVPLVVNKFVQTELPSNSLILVNSTNTTAELKLLKPQLYAYKIPVTIKNSPFFHVSYIYHNPDHRLMPKKMCLWDHRTAVDVRASNVRTPDENLAPNDVNVPSTIPTSGNINASRSTTPTTAKFNPVNSNPLTSPASLINGNSMLKSLLQNSTTTAEESIATTEQGSSVSEQSQSVSNPAPPPPPQQFGTIRVKNVWELT